jgi:hypothetical protein
MDIHHAMIVRSQSSRLYEALILQRDLEVWMDAPVLAQPEAGSTLEFQYDQGQRTLKIQVLHLENGKQVKWRVIQPMWPGNLSDQFITWTLIPQEASTLVDFRMEGWTQDDEIYASVSYKWASFMMRLKIYLDDMREIATLPLVK